MYTTFTASGPTSTRFTSARRISRRAFQSADWSPLRTRSANPSNCPIAAANSASSDSRFAADSASPCNFASRALASRTRGSNSALSSSPSSYASISRAIPRFTWAINLPTWSLARVPFTRICDRRTSYSRRTRSGSASRAHASSHTALSNTSVRHCLASHTRFPPNRYASVPMHR